MDTVVFVGVGGKEVVDTVVFVGVGGEEVVDTVALSGRGGGSGHCSLEWEGRR